MKGSLIALVWVNYILHRLKFLLICHISFLNHLSLYIIVYITNKSFTTDPILLATYNNTNPINTARYNREVEVNWVTWPWRKPVIKRLRPFTIVSCRLSDFVRSPTRFSMFVFLFTIVKPTKICRILKNDPWIINIFDI